MKAEQAKVVTSGQPLAAGQNPKILNTDRPTPESLGDLSEEVVLLRGPILLTSILRELGLTATHSETVRMLNQGAVKINGTPVHMHTSTMLKARFFGTITVGKRRSATVKVI